MEQYAIRQLSIFMENNKGELSEISTVLSNEKINIKSLLLVDSTDFGILRLIVEDTDKAIQILVDSGYTVKVNQVFAVKAADKIGSFSQVVKILSQQDINILYTYAFSEDQFAVFIFKVEKGDFDNAVEALKKSDIELFDNSFII
jgi:hypothetical protein